MPSFNFNLFYENNFIEITIFQLSTFMLPIWTLCIMNISYDGHSGDAASSKHNFRWQAHDYLIKQFLWSAEIYEFFFFFFLPYWIAQSCYKKKTSLLVRGRKSSLFTKFFFPSKIYVQQKYFNLHILLIFFSFVQWQIKISNYIYLILIVH